MNFDNSDPTLKFLSGLPNTDSVDTEVISPVPATVATTFGNDTVNGGDGEDTINGMEGHDVLNGDNGDDVINGGAGFDSINGGEGNDSLSGGSENDTINGNNGNDTINGDSGNDLLNGGDGNDVINGGAGNDTITGGLGADTITGGTGRDIMTGGASPDGATDVFVFAPGDSTGAVGTTDQITDFEPGVFGDVIRLDLDLSIPGTEAVFLGSFGDTTNVLAALNGGTGPAPGRTVYDFNANLLYVDVLGTGDINSAMTIEIQVIGGGGIDASNVQFV